MCLKTENLWFNLQQRQETFFFFQVLRLGLVSIKSHIEWVLGTLSPCAKWPENEAAQGQYYLYLIKVQAYVNLTFFSFLVSCILVFPFQDVV